MKTYLHILRLRWKLWGIFGVPFSLTVPSWRVGLHRVKAGGFAGQWVYRNYIDRDGTVVGLLLGTVEDLTLADALVMAKHQALDLFRAQDNLCPCAQYLDAPAGDPATRICSACARKFIAPELDKPKHELQYSGSLMGIVCACGWTSLEGNHVLHTPNQQACDECAAIFTAFLAHLATTTVEACECMKWKAAPPDNYAAGICGKCNRSCFPGVLAEDPIPEPEPASFVHQPFTDPGRTMFWPGEDTPGRPPHSGQGDTK